MILLLFIKQYYDCCLPQHLKFVTCPKSHTKGGIYLISWDLIEAVKFLPDSDWCLLCKALNTHITELTDADAISIAIWSAVFAVSNILSLQYHQHDNEEADETETNLPTYI